MKRKLKSRAYHRWTPKEDERLVALRQRGLTAKQIAKKLRRPLSGTRARLSGQGFSGPFADEYHRRMMQEPNQFGISPAMDAWLRASSRRDWPNPVH